jgi:hypothetical protein
LDLVPFEQSPYFMAILQFTILFYMLEYYSALIFYFPLLTSVKNTEKQAVKAPYQGSQVKR